MGKSSQKAATPAPRGRAPATIPARAEVVARADAFLARRRLHVIGVIVAVSVLLRVTYLAQLWDDACFYQHRWVNTDMNFNDAWAKEIASGDVLVDKPFHPMNDWQWALARKYLSAHPEKAQDLLRSWQGPPPAPPVEKLLWDQWYGGKTLHQEPLYPYLLALSYKLFGDDARPMLILQLLAGVLGNVLVYLIGRRYFGDLVGVIAGAMATLCGPILYYEMVLLRDSMLATAGLAIVLVAQRALDKSTVPRWLGAGAVFGAALLLKTSLVLMLLVVLAALLWTHRREPLKLLARAGALIGGVGLLLAPAVGRNLAVGAPPLGLSAVGPVTFVFTNTADYARGKDYSGGVSVSDQYAADIMGASGGKFLPAALAALATHDGAGSYLRQLWLKTAAVFRWYEVPNNTNFYYYRLHASVLRLLPVTFLLISPLALAGLALAAPRVRQLGLLYALVLTTLAVLLGFGVFSRLRLPLVAPLLLFASLTIVTIVRWASARDLAKLAGLAAAMVVLAPWTSRPLSASEPLIRPADYYAPFMTYYDPRVEEAYARRDPTAAAALLADSLRYEPAEVRRLDAQHPVSTAYEGRLAALFAQVRSRYVAALQSRWEQETDPRKKEQLAQQITRQRQRLAQLAAAVSARGPG